MSTTQTQVSASPLSMTVLKSAGVSFADALWFNRLPLAQQFVAMAKTERGQSILNAVRDFNAKKDQVQAS